MAACRAGREDPPDHAARRDPEAPVGLAVQVVAALVGPVARAGPVVRAVRVGRRRHSRPPNVPRRSLPRLAAAS
ncbi:hypothetical protein GCM10022380_27060 [Amycolatopsis tucumanensis]|uniref:Uncharacterized protein n=1 Tax=Amycolatopsis tucumanensis TaxID=401106 RepID=A0ABP7I6G0_9PSEU